MTDVILRRGNLDTNARTHDGWKDRQDSKKAVDSKPRGQGPQRDSPPLKPQQQALWLYYGDPGKVTRRQTPASANSTPPAPAASPEQRRAAGQSTSSLTGLSLTS